MKKWFSAALLGVTMISIPVCPAMAFGVSTSHEATMASEMPGAQHVHLPTPSRCLGVPAHPSEQGVPASSVSVVVPVVAMAPATVAYETIVVRHREHDVRIRAPDKKFECRTKAKRE